MYTHFEEESGVSTMYLTDDNGSSFLLNKSQTLKEDVAPRRSGHPT